MRLDTNTPPREHQFKPGQSGNPKGTPKARCNLWLWVCTYMNMTNPEIGKLKKSELTRVQKTALKITKDMMEGKAGTLYMAKHFFDREEGKAVEHVVMDNQQEPPTPEECENVCEIMRRNFEAIRRNNNGQGN